MKLTFSAALVLTLIATISTFAAETPKPASKKPGTTPTSSKIIVIPPATDPAIKNNQPPKLFSSEMSGQDLLFFTTVVDAGRLQALLVDLLKTKAQSEQIKELAGMLAVTQEQENVQVAKLAATKGWTVSTEPTAAQKAAGATLEKQRGPNFDKAVMDKVVAASQQSVGAYEAAAQSPDAEIKKFSERILPLARERLLLVQRMTGAGKAGNELLRTGTTPKPEPRTAPKPQATGTPRPPIIPSKTKATPTPASATPPPEAKPVPR